MSSVLGLLEHAGLDAVLSAAFPLCAIGLRARRPALARQPLWAYWHPVTSMDLRLAAVMWYTQRSVHR